MQSSQTQSPSSGILLRIRARLVGEPDPVDEQLREIARHKAAMARTAHSAAFLLIILFSAGSLVALSGGGLASITVAQSDIQPATMPAVSAIRATVLAELERVERERRTVSAARS